MQAASDQEPTRPSGSSAAEPPAGQPSPARTSAPSAGQGGRPPQIPPQQKPRGRGLALLALVAAVLAAVLAGTLYWRTYYEPNPLTFRVVQIETRVTELDQRVRDSAAEIERAKRLREQEGVATKPTEAGSVPAMDAALGPSAPATTAPLVGAPDGSTATTATGAAVPADWQLAEVRYLLRMANHRLQLERDVRGAALLLRAADDSLARLDDPRFTPVRGHIAEELLALEALPGADAEGLFLALEAIKSDLDDLKPRAPSFEPATRPQPAADGTLANLWAAVSELIRFRRLDSPTEALLLPEEALYLELNLRLMLERAQLAALRREQPIYDSSIAEARAWVARYLDPTDISVQRVSEGLAAVAPMELAAPLPDLSASLVTLDAALGAAP